MKRLTPLPEHEQVLQLNLVDMCSQGWWKCLHCHRPTRLETQKDALEHEEYEVCFRCGSKAVKYMAPVFTDEKQRRSA
jgi:DNA-directed RNA polymerase subunit RPC12/RpoP